MTTLTAVDSLDLRGKKITTFILYEVVKRMKTMEEGEVLELVTEPYEPIDNDVPAWCRMTGHKLVSVEDDTDRRTYVIEKGESRRTGRQLAAVIGQAGLLELLSPLGFALAAALEGNDVHLYFQGPAVRVLKRGFTGNLPGMSRPFSRFARKALTDIGHIPAQEKVRQLKELGAHLYICGPSMEHFGVEKDDLIFDDIVVSEYLTFMEAMTNADIHFFVQ